MKGGTPEVLYWGRDGGRGEGGRMTITITRLTHEHWRVLVLQGDEEVYHSSGDNRDSAMQRVITYLTQQLGEEVHLLSLGEKG